MNNNLFALTRYLRDLKFDITLYVLESEHEHFRPFNDTFDLDYQTYTEYINWSRINFHSYNFSRIKEEFKKFSIVACQGVAPAFFYNAGVKIDIFIPYGSDLYELPFMFPMSIFHKLKFGLRNLVLKNRFNAKKFASAQLKGIQSSKKVLLYNNEWRGIIEELKLYKKWERIPIPMIYEPLYNSNNLELLCKQSHWYVEMSKIRDQFEDVFLSHSRHYWKTHKGGSRADVLSNKGNDKLIKGFANFIKNNKRESALVLLEYGPDVMASKRLITKLNIEENVFWLPKSPRKEIMIFISLSDVVCSEFSNSWVGGGVIFEALAMGKPLLGFRNDQKHSNYESLYPMLNAFTEMEIENKFKFYIDNKAKVLEMGKEGKLWYEVNIVNSSLDYFKQFFNE